MTKIRNFVLGLTAIVLMGAGPADRSIFNLDSAWENQDGHATKFGDFAGGPVVVAMFYAHCQTVCPMTVQQLQKVEHDLSPDALRRVRFVLVSLDPARDSPSELRAFMAKHRLESKRWTALAGKADAVRELAAFLDVKYKADAGGTIAHSSGAFVLDRQGDLQASEPDLAGNARAITSAVERLIR